MLQEFRVHNFKSLVDATYKPADVSVLVGANNSGKSNLLQALRFLSLSETQDLKKAAEAVTGEPLLLPNWGEGAPAHLGIVCEAVLQVEGHPLTLVCSLEVAVRRPRAREVPLPELSVLRENICTDRPVGSAGINLANRDASGAWFVFGWPDSAARVQVKPSSSQALLSEFSGSPDSVVQRLLRDYLASWLYYELDPAQLRSSVRKPLDWLLEPDGSNLASVLFNLKSVDERRYRDLVAIVRKIEPDLEALNFVSATSAQVFMFAEYRHGHRLPVEELSGGTLRYMALAYILLANREPSDEKLPFKPLIMIEEPENGLYVRQLKPLMERFWEASDERQFIFTSHSPYLIDLWDKCPEGITVVTKEGTRSELHQADPERVRELVKEMPLGEAHFREIIVKP